MRFEPLFAWWLLLPMVLAGLGLITRYIWQYRAARKTLPIAWTRRGILLIVIVLMVLGPSLPGGTTSPGVANLDVIFAVDTTASMGALDYNGEKQRLDGIKTDLTALGSGVKGAHLSIITFDSKATLLLPATSDYATFGAVVQNLTPEMYNTSNGSSIDKPVDLLKQQLSNSKAAYPDRKRILFFLSDGEQTTGKPIGSFSGLAKLADGGAVLGYGTAKGSKMIRYSGLQTTSNTANYVTTPDPGTKQFVPAISKIDETALKKIAAELGLDYVNRNQGGSVAQLLQGSKTTVMIDRSKKVTHYVNIYWLLAIPVVGLLFWEWRKVFKDLLTLTRANRKATNAQ